MQFLEFAGEERLPARDLKAQTALAAVERKGSRVSPTPWKNIWRVDMSRAISALNRSCTVDIGLYSHHSCACSSTTCVSSLRSRSVLTPRRSSCQQLLQGDAGCGNARRDQMRRAGYGKGSAEQGVPGPEVLMWSHYWTARRSHPIWRNAPCRICTDDRIASVTRGPVDGYSDLKNASED
jgi:hypothetical protein